MVIVNPVLTGNTITAPVENIFCATGDASQITGSTPSGGNGLYSYQWLQSTNGISGWVNATAGSGNATSIHFDPPVRTADIWYKRVVTSGGCTDESASVKITIEPALAQTSPSPVVQAICVSGTPGLITGGTPTGGDGSYTYKWETATFTTSNFPPSTVGLSWSDAPGTNDQANYQPPALSVNATDPSPAYHWYRRTIVSGSCTTAHVSDLVRVSVKPEAQSADLSVNAPAITYGSSAVATPSVVGGTANIATPVYKWYTTADKTTQITSSGDFTVSGAGVLTVARLGAGTYTYYVTVSGDQKCENDQAKPVTITVNKAPLTITAQAKNKTYDAAIFAGPYTVSYSGFKYSENSSNTPPVSGNLIYTGTSQTAIDAGTYPIVISTSDLVYANYDVTYVGNNLTINKKALTITAENKNKVYDGVKFTEPTDGTYTVTYAGFVPGEDNTNTLPVSGSLKFTGTSTSGINVAANYTILLSTSDVEYTNYSVSYQSAILSITPRPITITALDSTKTYGDAMTLTNTRFALTSGSYALSQSISTVTLASSGTSVTANVGTYDITPSAAVGAGGFATGNYTITYVKGTLTVTARAIVISAIDRSKVYGTTRNFTTSDVQVTSGTLAPSNTITSVSMTSTGSVNTAVVNGGTPYLMDLVSVVIQRSGTTTTANYSITYVDADLTVTPKPVRITAANKSKNYDGLIFSGGYTATDTGFLFSQTRNTAAHTGVLIFSGTSQSAVNVGTYPIELNTSTLDYENYSVTYVAGTLTINKKALTVKAEPKTKVYDGVKFTEPADGTYTVTYTGFENGEDEVTAAHTGGVVYNGAAKTAVDVGAYLINISSSSNLSYTNYTVTYQNDSLRITPRPITITALDSTKTYGDAITLTNTRFALTAGSYAASESVTTVTLTSTGTPAMANATTHPIVPAAPFTGANGFKISNYAVTYVNGTLTVNPRPITLSAAHITKTYGMTRNVSHSDVSVTAGTLVNGDAINSATISSAGSVNTAVVNGGTPYDVALAAAVLRRGVTDVTSNYTITYVDGSIVVNKKPVRITAENKTKVYNGLIFSGGYTATDTGFLFSQTRSSAAHTGDLYYTGTSQTAKNVGSYPIELGTSDLVYDNYSVTYVDATLSITPKALTIKANDQSKIYDGLVYSGGNTMVDTGYVAGENISYLSGTLTYAYTQGVTPVANPLNAGVYTITPGGLTAINNNYSITYIPGTLTIHKKVVEIMADSINKTYGSLVTFSPNDGRGVSIRSGAVLGTHRITLATLASTGAPVSAALGNYPIILSAVDIKDNNGAGVSVKDNYDITLVNGILSVVKAHITVKADNIIKTYGTATTLPTNGTGVTIISGSLISGDAITAATLSSATGTPATATVGSHTLTLSAITIRNAGVDITANYDISLSNGNITVNKAPLTVTVENKSKIYDGNTFNGGYTVTYTGFVNSETENTPGIFNGTSLNYGGTAIMATNAGAYTITASGLTANNYTINYVNGALVINKKLLIVTADDQSVIYTGAAFTGPNTVNYNGFENGETSAVLTGTLAYTYKQSSSTVTPVNAGTYDIVPSGYNTPANYSLVYVNGTLVIHKKQIVVAADSHTKTYGTAITLPANGTGLSITSGLYFRSQPGQLRCSSIGRRGGQPVQCELKLGNDPQQQQRSGDIQLQHYIHYRNDHREQGSVNHYGKQLYTPLQRNCLHWWKRCGVQWLCKW
jgi:hypothetical protein